MASPTSRTEQVEIDAQRSTGDDAYVSSKQVPLARSLNRKHLSGDGADTRREADVGLPAPEAAETPRPSVSKQTSVESQTTDSLKTVNNMRSVYNNNGRATVASRHSVTQPRLPKSYDETVSALQNVYLSSADKGHNDDAYDDAASAVTVISSRRHSQKKSSATSTQSQTDFSPHTHTKMKTRGTSVGFDSDLYDPDPNEGHRSVISEDDDADFDDTVSRVHYKPNRKHEKRVRVETYREVYTQTEQNPIATPQRVVTSRPLFANTYSHSAARERSRLPHDWHDARSDWHDARSERYDVQAASSELSTRVSQNWYEKEDAPELWDPDRMLNMFARELDKKATTGVRLRCADIAERLGACTIMAVYADRYS